MEPTGINYKSRRLEMNKFKATFRFYEGAAPFPGTCLRCGTTNKLWHLGEIPATNMACYYCDRCLVEIAMFTGMVRKEDYDSETTKLEETVTDLEAQLSSAPLLLKELSENVNNILSDFVTSLASVASNDLSTSGKSDKADTGSVEGKHGATAEAGQGKSKGTKPSSESFSK
jgi:hypothetical protein